MCTVSVHFYHLLVFHHILAIFRSKENNVQCIHCVKCNVCLGEGWSVAFVIKIYGCYMLCCNLQGARRIKVSFCVPLFFKSTSHSNGTNKWGRKIKVNKANAHMVDSITSTPRKIEGGMQSHGENMCHLFKRCESLAQEWWLDCVLHSFSRCFQSWARNFVHRIFLVVVL